MAVSLEVIFRQAFEGPCTLAMRGNGVIMQRYAGITPNTSGSELHANASCDVKRPFRWSQLPRCVEVETTVDT